MSVTAATTERAAGRAHPLVAVVSSVPMIFEALREALGVFAEVQSFPGNRGTAGLLRSIRPAAVVVDDDEDLAEAQTVAQELGFSLVHLALADRCVRVLRGDTWVVVDEDGGLRPETVRDVVAAGLFAKDDA